MLQMGKFTYEYIDRCLGAVCREQNLNNVIWIFRLIIVGPEQKRIDLTDRDVSVAMMA